MYITLNTGQKVTEVYDLSKMSVVEKKLKKKIPNIAKLVQKYFLEAIHNQCHPFFEIFDPSFPLVTPFTKIGI